MNIEEINFEEITLRQQLGTRGGGIEIDLSTLGFEGEKMAVFQNYLGGGMLGAIGVNDTIRAHGKEITLEEAETLDKVGEAFKKYMHGITNPDTEWESQSFDQNQGMPSSAY